MKLLREIGIWLAMLGGYRRDAIERTPHGRLQATLLGALIPLIALLSGIWAGYAASLVVETRPVTAIAAGMLWGTIVLLLEALLVRGIDKFQSPRQQARAILLRLPLCLVVAGLIGEVATLHLASTTLEREGRRVLRNQLLAERADNARLENVRDRQSAAEAAKQQLEAQRDRLLREPDSFEYQAARDAATEADARHTRVAEATAKTIATARRQLEVVDTTTATGAERALRLQHAITDATRQQRKAQGELTTARSAVETARAEWVRTEREKAEVLARGFADAQESHDVAQTRAAERDIETDRESARLHKPDLITQYTLMRRITADPQHPDSSAIRAFERWLNATFLTLELLIVSLKVLSRPTSLDHALRAVELEDQERVTLATNDEIERLRLTSEIGRVLQQNVTTALREAMDARIRAAAGDVDELRYIAADLHRLATA